MSRRFAVPRRTARTSRPSCTREYILWKACVRCLGTGPSDVPSEIRLRRKSL